MLLLINFHIIKEHEVIKMDNSILESQSTLSTNLRILREVRNLTQQQVADLINLSRSSYTYYENDGREPSLDTLLSLSKLYNTSIDSMLTSSNVLRSAPVMFNAKDMLTVDILEKDEQNVVLNYRMLSDEDKSKLANIIHEMRKEPEEDK